MDVADFAHQLTFKDLPEPVVEHARRCLLDLVGVAASGRPTELARITTANARELFNLPDDDLL